MSDDPVTNLTRFTDTNPMLWDQGMSVVQGNEWQMNTGYFPGIVANPYGPIAISINRPNIFLELNQFIFTEYQQQWSVTALSLADNIRTLTKEMDELKEEIRQLSKLRTFVVPLTTLAPAPFQITQQIPVTIEGDGEEFTATFTEANVSASGETEADAIANFKDSLVSSFEILEELPASRLGPLPMRQWTVLKNVLRRHE